MGSVWIGDCEEDAWLKENSLGSCLIAIGCETVTGCFSSIGKSNEKSLEKSYDGERAYGDCPPTMGRGDGVWFEEIVLGE